MSNNVLAALRLPRELLPICEKLVARPTSPALELENELQTYLEQLDEIAERREFLNIQLARSISATLFRIIRDVYASGSAEDQNLIQLAVAYFTTPKDADDDFDSLLGFEDDAIVLNAVLTAIGRVELAIKVP